MDLYFLPLACSLATRIALYETNLEANFIEVDTFTKTLVATSEDYRRVHPLGLVPALRTDEGDLLTENIAVLRYVARRGELWSEAHETLELQWLSFVATELHAGLFAPQFERPSSPEARAQARRRGEKRLAHLDRHLDGRKHLLDDFSVADAYLLTVLNFSRGCDLDLSPWPHVLAYFKRGCQRPSVARAMAEELPLYLAEQARHQATA